MLYSQDDARSFPTERLIDVGLAAASSARTISLADIVARLGGRFPYADTAIDLWPGEHYRLLAGVVQVLQPKLVIEIGTAEGISALTLLKYLPRDGRVVSFDIVPWAEYPRSCLAIDDFADGRLAQVVDDIGDRATCERHAQLLRQADLIFLDAAKDGFLERRLIANLDALSFASMPVIVFDDIRLWNMLAIWRDLRWPKLDLTSFGHWCGTGLAEPIGRA